MGTFVVALWVSVVNGAGKYGYVLSHASTWEGSIYHTAGAPRRLSNRPGSNPPTGNQAGCCLATWFIHYPLLPSRNHICCYAHIEPYAIWWLYVNTLLVQVQGVFITEMVQACDILTFVWKLLYFNMCKTDLTRNELNLYSSNCKYTMYLIKIIVFYIL